MVFNLTKTESDASKNISLQNKQTNKQNPNNVHLKMPPLCNTACDRSTYYQKGKSCRAASHSHWQRDPWLRPRHLHHIQAGEGPEQQEAGAAHVREQDPPVPQHLQLRL